MQWSAQELEWQAAFFSIDDNEDKPILNINPKLVSVKDSIQDLKKVLGE